jgi:predicted nucleic acid-binding protein
MTGRTMSETPATLPREVFVDTSALYAAVNAAALLKARLGFEAARMFFDLVVPALDIAWVDANLHARGLEAWLAAGRRSLSVIDCVSFALMHELHLDTAFTFDRHFAEQGFHVLPEA